MAHPALPTYISPSRAAALTGRSRAHIDCVVRDGSLPAEGRVHKRIRLADLETSLGREVTLDDWASSERCVERMRETQRTYNTNRARNGGPGAPCESPLDAQQTH